MNGLLRGAAAAILLSAPLLHAQLPQACNAFPNGCLYSPGAPLNFSTTASSLNYRDAFGQTRTVELYFRVPAGVAGALPVVVWSHESGLSAESKDILAKWAETTARAGYLSVTVAHADRDVEDWLKYCESTQRELLDCPRPYAWDWPVDLKQVLDYLERLNLTGPGEVRGKIDMARLALAGHSDGSSGVISLAGAKRLITQRNYEDADDFTDPRPIAFVTLSPQGPNLEGFFDTEVGRPVTSWIGIKRPVLTVTSAGDKNCPRPGNCYKGDTPSRRRTVQTLLPSGGKYLMYVNSVKMSHDFLGTLDTAACEAAGVPPADCSRFDDWLRSTVVAFLDATVRARAAAQTWLQNDLIVPASGRVVEWERK
ncbi:MAG: hypothetical protein HY820_36800 [Acidobacteria bacterium]|nr:hypothetical protein [Acidobacteriota bacterium]